MPRRSTLRASDADRDGVAERLRAAATEGRLSTDELDERLSAALRARTYGELDPLLADLPVKTPTVRGRRSTALAITAPIAATMVSIVAITVLLALVIVIAMIGAAWFGWMLIAWFLFGSKRRHMRRRHPMGPGPLPPRGPGIDYRLQHQQQRSYWA
jgi:hypothetical protein